MTKTPLQIHCFGDSWTYGWDVKQEESFPHLLGDENTSVWNYGAGKTGLDWTMKKSQKCIVISIIKKMKTLFML